MIPRAKLEDGFEEVLKILQPKKQLFELAKVMMQDAWNARLSSVMDAKDEVKRQHKVFDKQNESLLDRIVDAGSPSAIEAYETRLSQRCRLSPRSITAAALKMRLPLHGG